MATETDQEVTEPLIAESEEGLNLESADNYQVKNLVNQYIINQQHNQFKLTLPILSFITLVSASSLYFYEIMTDKEFERYSADWLFNMIGTLATNFLVSANILYLIQKDKHLTKQPKEFELITVAKPYNKTLTALAIASAMPLAASALANKGIISFIITLVSNGLINFLPMKIIINKSYINFSKQHKQHDQLANKVWHAIKGSLDESIPIGAFNIKDLSTHTEQEKIDEKYLKTKEIFLNTFGYFGAAVGIAATSGYQFSIFSSMRDKTPYLIVPTYAVSFFLSIPTFTTLVMYFSYQAFYEMAAGTISVVSGEMSLTETGKRICMLAPSIAFAYFSTAPGVLAAKQMLDDCSIPMFTHECSAPDIIQQIIKPIVIAGITAFNSINMFQLVEELLQYILKHSNSKEEKSTINREIFKHSIFQLNPVTLKATSESIKNSPPNKA